MLYIGHVAKLTGATPRAIRLYEAMGLIKVMRHGQYRVYEAAHVEFISLIRQAQELGITLSELKTLKDDNDSLDWNMLLVLLHDKLLQLQQQKIQLQHQIKQVEHYTQIITDCLSQRSAPCR